MRISAMESVRPECRTQLGLQDLDGDLSLVLQVLGEIHGRHAARAKLPLDAVAIGERLDQRGDVRE